MSNVFDGCIARLGGETIEVRSHKKKDDTRVWCNRRVSYVRWFQRIRTNCPSLVPQCRSKRSNGRACMGLDLG
jgi:hypothetical protein